jgi:hypothetical protein
MIITTKYSIGDEVWYMNDNKPVQAKVCDHLHVHQRLRSGDHIQNARRRNLDPH